MNTKNLYGGTLGTTSATLFTASTETLVKEIILCNKTASIATATITFNGINIVCGKSIAANDTLIIPLNSVLDSGKIIAGLSGTASSIDAYISGVEVG